MMSCSINSKRRLQISPFKSLWAHILFNSFAGRASQLYLVGKIVKVIYYFYDKRLIYIYIYIIDRKADSFEMNELIGFGLNLQGCRCLIITPRYRHLCI